MVAESGNLDIEIDHIEYDSRLVRKGTLFCAVTGYQRDGFQFVPEAVSKGAVAVMGQAQTCPEAPGYIRVKDIRRAMADVAAAFYGFPGTRLRVCGVTGTNGKTTTCHLLRSILQRQSKAIGLVCSTMYDTGKETFPAERTTPEALDLQRLLFLMKQHGCDGAVIEVSSHALALKRVEGINFHVAVFTNLSRDHLDFHQSMEEYFKTKALLLQKLNGPLSHAVLNLDQPEFRELFGSRSASYLSFSVENQDADVHVGAYEIRFDRTVFDLVTPMGMQTITLHLPGRFNLQNAIGAAAGALAYGVDVERIVEGLEHAAPVPGRFMPISVGQPFGVYVDYAHTPDALEKLCQSARAISDGRLLILFGCGGDRDQGKRPLMGKAATTAADYAVVTSDNPRSEDPHAIIKHIKPGLVKGRYDVEPDRGAAIRLVLQQARPGDIVLLAGKGAECFQEVQGKRHDFSDSAKAEKTLAEMGYAAVSETEEH